MMMVMTMTTTPESFEISQKWSPSTLAKWTDRELSRFLGRLLLCTEYSHEEKTKRVHQALTMLNIVRDNCFPGPNQWSFKKIK